MGGVKPDVAIMAVVGVIMIAFCMSSMIMVLWPVFVMISWKTRPNIFVYIFNLTCSIISITVVQPCNQACQQGW
jgi:hypothetical protein